MKIRTFLAAALCLALLPTIAAAENTVEALPTTAPMTEPAADVNEYAFDDLDPYYEDMDESQLPAFTENEKARFAEAQRHWDAGERPGDSILDVTENIRVSLVRLPAEQYDGHSWFLFLPYEELTDRIVESMMELLNGGTPESQIVLDHLTLVPGITTRNAGINQ